MARFGISSDNTLGVSVPAIRGIAKEIAKAADDKFVDFLPVIEREATDDRNFVKKAVNWALR